MKGDIQPDHIPVNKFQLIVVGLPPIHFTQLSGIEEELDVTDLPDRTKATGGNTQPVEFTAMTPLHHTVERAALEAWFQEGQDPVSPTYQKAASLIHSSIGGGSLATFSLIGLFISKRKLPDLDTANEGEMAVVEWTFNANDLLPV